MYDFINNMFSNFAVTGGAFEGASPFAVCFSLAACALVAAGLLVSSSQTRGAGSVAEDGQVLGLDWMTLSEALGD